MIIEDVRLTRSVTDQELEEWQQELDRYQCCVQSMTDLQQKERQLIPAEQLSVESVKKILMGEYVEKGHQNQTEVLDIEQARLDIMSSGVAAVQPSRVIQ